MKTVGKTGPGWGRLRVLTYNIHSCINIRRKTDIRGVINIMDRFCPDVIALQEVDVNKARTGRVDQARLIARHLKMKSRFLPLVRESDEAYGLAVLSRYPLQKIKYDRLLAADPDGRTEPRGAMWVRLNTPMGPIHFVNTHLGLTAKERILQIRALFGDGWGMGVREDQPLILCGDFNAGVRSPVYRKITACLTDVQTAVRQRGYPRATFISMYPILRIDHIFVSRHLLTEAVVVPRSFAARTASDHLPVFAEVRLRKDVKIHENAV